MEMYRSLAHWWSILTPEGTYDVEANLFWELLARPKSMLELGSGIGAIAASLGHLVACTLVDRSSEMLAQSRLRNPNATHVCSDIESLSLAAQFDSVLFHDAVMYMTSRSQLIASFQTAWKHLAKGGRFLVVPDCVRETFVERSMSGGAARDGRAVQLMEWHWAEKGEVTNYRVEFSFLFREDGRVFSHHETHLHGLFSISEYTKALGAANFHLLDVEPEGRYFLAQK